MNYGLKIPFQNRQIRLIISSSLGVTGRELVLDRQREEGVRVALLQAGQQVVQQPVQRLRLQRRGGVRRLGARRRGGRDLRCLRHLPGFKPGWQFNSVKSLIELLD